MFAPVMQLTPFITAYEQRNLALNYDYCYKKFDSFNLTLNGEKEGRSDCVAA